MPLPSALRLRKLVALMSAAALGARDRRARDAFGDQAHVAQIVEVDAPGLTIVAPSHLVDPGELLMRAVTLVDDPVLFVENKLLYSHRLIPATAGRLEQFFVRATNSCFPTL